MDAATILIVAFTLAIFIVPIWYYNGYQNRKEGKLKAIFMESAEKQGIRPDSPETWNGRYAIGIDAAAKRLFYLKKTEDRLEKLVVELSGVETCRVVSTKRNVLLSTGNTTVTDRLILSFQYRSRQKGDTELEFFNAEDGNTLNQEYILAEKWAGIVNNHLKTTT